MQKLKLFPGVLAVIFILSLPVKATGPENAPVEKKHHEKFKPGDFIFGHIGDSYSWNILDLKSTSISIPLPVILYSRERGLALFWSSRFHHGHASYKGFRIADKGNHKGKIIETLQNGQEVLPFDISITKNIAALWISVIIILSLFISIGQMYKKRINKAPKGIQSWLEPVILFVRDEIAKPSIGEKHYEKYMPFLLSVFFFIWINNMLGLIPLPPGGPNVTGNIAVTMVLAFCTFAITTFSGNKNYWKHIINTPGVPLWLKIPIPIIPLIETIGIFIKPVVLMVRLFANITAGHIITLGFLSLIFLFADIQPMLGYGVSVVSVLFMTFMTFLELLVAFIQAYVFTFLSALYFGMAVEEHH